MVEDKSDQFIGVPRASHAAKIAPPREPDLRCRILDAMRHAGAIATEAPDHHAHPARAALRLLAAMQHFATNTAPRAPINALRTAGDPQAAERRAGPPPSRAVWASGRLDLLELKERGAEFRRLAALPHDSEEMREHLRQLAQQYERIAHAVEYAPKASRRWRPLASPGEQSDGARTPLGTQGGAPSIQGNVVVVSFLSRLGCNLRRLRNE